MTSRYHFTQDQKTRWILEKEPDDDINSSEAYKDANIQENETEEEYVINDADGMFVIGFWSSTT